MSFSYQVILRPTDVKFSINKIPNKFDNGTSLEELLGKLTSGKTLSKDVTAIEVVWDCEKWEWYALNNRRLWVFQEMERAGKIGYVGMSRVELVGNESALLNKPATLYKKVELFKPQWDVVVKSDENSESKRTKLMSLNFDCLPKNQNREKKYRVTKPMALSPKLIKNDDPYAAADKVRGTQDIVIIDLVVKSSSDDVPTVDLIKTIGELALSRSESSADDAGKSNDKMVPKTVKNMMTVTEEIKKTSLVRSKCVSLDNISHISAGTTLSSFSKEERIISENSGLSGYGYYHIYRTEYLDKLKAERNAALQRYKPYNVAQRSYSRSSNKTPQGSSLNLHSISLHSESLSYKEICESFTRKERAYSESSTNSRGRKRDRFDERGNSARNSSNQRDERNSSGKSRRLRLYSDDIECAANSGFQESHSNSKSSINSNVVPYDSIEYKTLKYSGIRLADLYAMWHKRRVEYLQKNQLAIMNSSSNNLYLCGLCFKKFCTIVDLQQHCESLLHYACITCGKFFSSYASLGQHCQRLSHQKD